MSMTKWTKDFPTEPGRYWFWGSQFKSAEVRMHSVRICRCGDGSLLTICDGSFMYESEKGDGWFTPAIVPEFPE